MTNHPVVSRAEWLAARTAFLEKKKAFTEQRDELNRQRRELPWEKSTRPTRSTDRTGWRRSAISLRAEASSSSSSVFFKDAADVVFHTYSTYARGIDLQNTTCNYIDLTPKGRDEGNRSQFWVRRHDEYER